VAGDATIVVVAAQTGPVNAPPEAVVDQVFADVDTATDGRIDLVVLPELFSRPFWCVGLSDPTFFDWAEPIDGPTVTRGRERAAAMGCHAVVPFFERGERPGEHYNSAVVVGPDGRLVDGVLPDGRRVHTYRKNALSAFNWDGIRNDEKYYFREGNGYPVFSTGIGRIGVLICYDRWFPEAWRLLGLAGAEIVCVPNASTGAGGELFVASMRTWAAQNVVFAVGVNRVGTESVGGVTTGYYGRSCVTTPRGRLLAEGSDTAAAPVVAEIDMDEVRRARLDLTMYRDRRPELYGPIGDR
jgi:N-carbamoylputrescine amidase